MSNTCTLEFNKSWVYKMKQGHLIHLFEWAEDEYLGLRRYQI